MSNTPRFKKTPIAVAVSAQVLALSLVANSAHAEGAEGNRAVLEEVIVTATRRSESQQDVAIAIQAISESKLEELRIDNFEDYIALIPGVSANGQGPGRQEVFIRGISAGRIGERIAALGSEPSVAIYLDEAPISTSGRNIDLYATDLNRIEVLKGPQGTLFGASSQAGTLRLISNKPQYEEFEVGVTLGAATISGGESDNNIEGFINVPLIRNRLALRVAAYRAEQGGFIDNIAATRQIPLSNPGFGGRVPTTRVTADNAEFVENDYNDAEYKGVRASLGFQINDNWEASVQYTNQSLETEGIFEFEPDVSSGSDFNTQTFTDNFADDDVNLTALQVNGLVGELELIYNGSFTDREFTGQTDYTGYANVGPFIPYYICNYPSYDFCGSPALFTDSFFETDRSVHELRVSTSADRRWRLLGGVFYDDQDTTERTNFVYPSSVDVGFPPNAPIPDQFASDPNVRDPGVTFFNDFVRDREEISFFGEIAYDITPDLTATFGARRYEIEFGLTGQSSFGSRDPASNGGVRVDDLLEGQTPTKQKDTIFKANLSWQVNDDVLLYTTFSQGFRSGGFNRNGTGTTDADVPFFFESDDADNYEFGWKAQFLDNSLQINGAVYYVEFSDLQQGVLDFSIDNVTFFDNVGEAEIFGVEFDTQWAVTEQLSVFGSFSYIDSELVDLPATLVNITPVGSELPFAPETEATLGARYEQQVGALTAFAQGIVFYKGEQFTSLVAAARFELDSYTTVNTSFGVTADSWSASLFAENLFNERGQLSAGAPDNVFRVIPVRPRTVGFRLTYNFLREDG